MEADTDLSNATERAHEMPESELGPREAQVKLPALITNIAEPLKGTHSPDKDAHNKNRRIIQGVCVVDFNHLVGPQVEYAYPSDLLCNEELCTRLPFLALPDGSHLSEEDFCYFHILCKSLHPETIFGISCNRQIHSDALVNKGAEVTRSTVQKAVVILATKPIFGPLREKLAMVTRAYFAQGDLSNTALLEEFYATLESNVQTMTTSDATGRIWEDESTLYMGTSIRNFLYQWRFKALSLIKLLLMQRRILVFGYPVERLCTLQYSLVALIPTLLSSLQDAASPELQSWSHNRIKAESLKMSDRQSLLTFMGLPLSLFSENSVFQPYCPLQQLGMMECKSYLIGTTNRIFKQQRDPKPDVIVDLNFTDHALANAVALTPADRSWMDQILTVIQDTWNINDPSQPVLMQYEGSDDYLRARFEEYVLGFLSTAKFTKHQPARTAETPLDNSSAEAQYGAEALCLFRNTRVFAEWDELTDESLCDLIGCKHPCSGKVSAISDVTLRLSAGLHDLRIDESLAPTREAIGAALQAGGAGLSKVANSWRSDLARFNQGWTTPKSLRSARNSTDMGTVSTENLPSTKEEPVASARETTFDENSSNTDPSSSAQSTSAQGYSAISHISSFLSSKKKAWTAARQGRNENTQ